MISIHALREEGDGSTAERAGKPVYFYPRPPRGGRRLNHIRVVVVFLISIHALREEGDQQQTALRWKSSISIHALREEGDAA